MKAHSGFTIIEGIIVCSIIGILLAVAIPAYQDREARAHCDGDQTCIDQVNAEKQSANGRPVLLHQGNSCFCGFTLLPNGNQLLDQNGHGIPCNN